MSAIGLIAVRLKSRRLPLKATLDLDGKPLIVRVYERVLCSQHLTKAIICTSTNSDDDRLTAIADRYNIPIFRGHEDDVMKRFLDCLKENKSELIVRITGDNPLTDPEIIDRMIESHIEANADYTRMNDLPIGVAAEVIAYSALQKAYALAEDSTYSEYMTWYFTKSNVFKLNMLTAPDNLARPSYRLTVDYPEDFELIKKIYEKFDFNSTSPKLEKIIEYLDKNPDLTDLNSNVGSINISNINTRLNIKKQ